MSGRSVFVPPSVGSPWLRRWLVGLASLVLAPVGAVAPAAAAVAAVASCAGEASADVDALAMAEACGQRVEVLSRRAETSLTYANPDGSFTSVLSPVPQRVRKGPVWVAVDPTLHANADGSVSPVAITEELTLSGGGSGPLLTFGAPGRRLSVSWPGGALPAPLLDGSTATWSEVLPGVDLRVEVGVSSYRQLLVVKTREAALNPALRRVSFDVSTDGLSLRTTADGRVEAVDGTGAGVFESPGAFMWDSPVPLVDASRSGAGYPVRDGDATPHRVERIEVQASGSALSVVPSTQMLEAADTVFPLYIDPAFSKPTPMWYTNVMDDNPNHPYYGEYSEMRVGRQWNTSHVWRAHMQFDIIELHGSTIVTAELSVTADHTADCASTSIQLWQTLYVASPSSYTWYNDSDGDWFSKLDTKTFSANEASCPKGDDENTFTGSLKSRLQASTGSSNRFGVGLRATNESNHYEWTKFLGNKTFLTVTYNRKPNVPTNMVISDCYLNCTSNPVVSRRDPELSVFATDPDPSTVLTVYFEVQTSAGAAVVTGTKTGYASGPTKPAQPARWRIAPALGDGTYRWRARSRDQQGSYSSYTGWFGFSTDSTAPAVPSVTPDDADLYFEDDGSGACSGGIGTPGEFNLTAEASVMQVYLGAGWRCFQQSHRRDGYQPQDGDDHCKPLAGSRAHASCPRLRRGRSLRGTQLRVPGLLTTCGGRSLEAGWKRR